MIRRPPRSTRTDHSFPTRRSSDLAYDQWRHYHESLQETEKSTLSTARLLAEYTARTFNAAEGALRAVARLQRDLESGLHDRADAHELLRALQGGTPEIGRASCRERVGEKV